MLQLAVWSSLQAWMITKPFFLLRYNAILHFFGPCRVCLPLTVFCRILGPKNSSGGRLKDCLKCCCPNIFQTWSKAGMLFRLPAKPACKTGPWYNARRLLRCLRSPSFVGVLGMVAAIGMIVPDLFGRFGGYLSPSMDLMLECFLFIFPHVSSIFSLNLHSLLYHGCDGCSLRKFSDVPCTIEVGEPCLVDVCWRDSISPVTEAIYKVPTAGWLQIFALAGAIEAWQKLQRDMNGRAWEKWGKSALIATRGIINWRFYSMLVDTVDRENRHRLGWFQRLYQFDVLFDIINIPSPSIYHVCQGLSITIDI